MLPNRLPYYVCCAIMPCDAVHPSRPPGHFSLLLAAVNKSGNRCKQMPCHAMPYPTQTTRDPTQPRKCEEKKKKKKKKKKQEEQTPKNPPASNTTPCLQKTARPLILPTKFPRLKSLGIAPPLLLTPSAPSLLQDPHVLDVRARGAHLRVARRRVAVRVAGGEVGEVEFAEGAEGQGGGFLGGGAVVALPDAGPFVAHGC
ncbi:hypothetical protein BKA81DRAFT_130542 [Phyllosticta paracitricarpa]